MNLAQVDWGSVPDWFAGIGAVLALLFAAIAVRVARNTFIQQSKELEEARLERRQRQASRIAGWVLNDGYSKVVHVRNSSDLPVFGLTIWWAIQRGELPHTWWHAQRTMVLAPGDIEIALDDAGQSSIPPVQIPKDTAEMMVAFTFRDAGGHHWTRSIFGELQARFPQHEGERPPHLAEWRRGDDHPFLASLELPWR